VHEVVSATTTAATAVPQVNATTLVPPGRDERRAASGDDSGFTLIELLMVIVILAILAAVVVFAVGSIRSRGQASACDTDADALVRAEESYFALHSTYLSEADLVGQFLTEQSSLMDIDLDTSTTPPTYEVIVQSPACGPVAALATRCPPGVTPTPNPRGHLSCNQGTK